MRVLARTPGGVRQAEARHATVTRASGWIWLSLLALVTYAATLLVHLDRMPLLNPDEAAYSEPAWTLLAAHRFGAPMYTGMFAIDQRWYFLWPGYAVLAAIPYAALGVNVLAVRLLSGAFGAALLASTWWLARQVAQPLLALPDNRSLERGPVESATWLRRLPGEPSAPLVPRGETPAADPICHPERSEGSVPLPTDVCRTALVATVALWLALVHPTLFFLSRFGRPEAAVTACAVLSSALGLWAWRVPGRARRHAAAGAVAGLAFLMHQYGAFAILALGAAYLLHPPREWRVTLRNTLIAGAGLTCVLLPWLVWIGADWHEFTVQLGAQLAYQRWRYPDATAAVSALRDLPGRYLIGQSDYPPGWRPWAEAARYVLGDRALAALASGAAGLPRAAVRALLYWREAGLVPLAHLLVVVLLALAVLAGIRRLRHIHAGATPLIRWVLLPAAVWVVGLAPIPNKWEGYTGAVAGYTAIVAAVGLAGVASRRWLARVFVAAVVACGMVWALAAAAALAQSPAPYAPVAAQLRDLVPAGEAVASPMREWFVFAGRNPAYTFEFRSIPPFQTSVMALIRQQRPRYLVLLLTEPAAERSTTTQRYYFIYPPWDELYAFIDQQTALVGTVSDPVYGTEVVRRVLDG